MLISAGIASEEATGSVPVSASGGVSSAQTGIIAAVIMLTIMARDNSQANDFVDVFFIGGSSFVDISLLYHFCPRTARMRGGVPKL